MFGPLVIVFAFAFGFTLTRASTCTVAATKRWVNSGKPKWLFGIAVAVGWSGVTLLVLDVLYPEQFMRALSAPLDLTLLLAAVMMGVGAYLNNGCFIGSVGRISEGDLSYLATFIGLIVARIISDLPLFAPLMGHLDDLQEPTVPTPVYWVALTVFSLLAASGIIWALKRRLQAVFALCLMGVFASLTFAHNPNWSYEAWIGQVANGRGLTADLQVEFSILALFSGAVLSRVLSDRFQLSAPKARIVALCFLGGIFMGLGAVLVPGGNDTLLLWTIPSFALHGLVAYVLMVLTVAALEMARKSRLS